MNKISSCLWWLLLLAISCSGLLALIFEPKVDQENQENQKPQPIVSLSFSELNIPKDKEVVILTIVDNDNGTEYRAFCTQQQQP